MKDGGVSVNASNDRMTWEQDKSNTTLTWPSPKPLARLGAATSQIIGLHHLFDSLILYPQFARCLTAGYSKRVHIHLHVLEEI